MVWRELLYAMNSFIQSWHLKLKYARLHYKHFGLFLTIKTILGKLGNIGYDKAVEFFVLLSGDYSKGKYYFKDSNVIFLLRKTQGIKIGIVRNGAGLGDTILLTSLITAIKEKWPESYLYLFISSENQRQFLARFKAIDKIIAISDKIDFNKASVELGLAKILSREYLDIVFLDRYVIRGFFKKEAPLKYALDKIFNQYNLNFYNFPHNANCLLTFKKNEYEIRSVSSGLNISPHRLTIILEDADYVYLKNLPETFATIHHGADSKIYFKREGNLQTKNWFVDRWAMVRGFIKSNGYDVIQIGVLNDEYIPGAIDMRGKTSVTEAAAILKKSVLHLDTEGGIVHLAKAVRTKSIVLFGPTAVEFYGYKDNVNIQSGNCKNCWWSTPDWQIRCPLDSDVPKCMDAISVKTVTNSILEFLNNQKECKPKYELSIFSLFSIDLIKENSAALFDIYKSAEIIPSGFNKNAVNRTTGTYIHGSKNWEYLYVFDCIRSQTSLNNRIKVLDAGAGRGALQLHIASENNSELYSCDLDYNDLSPYGENYGKAFLKKYHNLIKFRTCSIFNLPYEDEYFDVVYCVSVLEHFQNKKYALNELLRVLKTNGTLILTFDITSLSYLKTLTDKYRVDIFTDYSLKELLSKELNIEINITDSMLNKAIKEIADSKIEGIPHGLTVGGLCIKKVS